MGDAAVTLTASDNLSGVAATYYHVDDGAPQEGTHVDITGVGTHTLTYWSDDVAGNAEALRSAQITIEAPATPTATSTAVPPTTAPVNTATGVVPATNVPTQTATSTAVPPAPPATGTAVNAPFILVLHPANTPRLTAPTVTPAAVIAPPFTFDAQVMGPATDRTRTSQGMERVKVNLVTAPHATVTLRLTLTHGGRTVIRRNGRHHVHGYGYQTLYKATVHLTADGAGRVQRTLSVAYTPTRVIVGQVTLTAQTRRGTLARGWTVHLAPAPHKSKK